jgi:hypothetical protein
VCVLRIAMPAAPVAWFASGSECTGAVVQLYCESSRPQRCESTCIGLRIQCVRRLHACIHLANTTKPSVPASDVADASSALSVCGRVVPSTCHPPPAPQLTVTARLLEGGGVARLLGLMSPASGASSRRSTASSLLGASGRLPWSKSMTPRGQGQQAGKESPGAASGACHGVVLMAAC